MTNFMAVAAMMYLKAALVQIRLTVAITKTRRVMKMQPQALRPIFVITTKHIIMDTAGKIFDRDITVTSRFAGIAAGI